MAMAVEDLSFLHEMIARKYESEENVKTLYESLHGNNALREGETIDHKIADMNRLLDFAHIELRKAAAPPDNKVYWGVVNSLDDELSKLMTKYSPEDVAIFFAIAKSKEFTMIHSLSDGVYSKSYVLTTSCYVKTL
mmetsp:Transcript_17727/g.71514  ORF Transcript_17727/g.71514 Transcript_17727/m.71514 type:complete len:136 (-) Transcript_17727:461-868(-)